MIILKQTARYANILTDAIISAGFTYQQIVDMCKTQGLNISKSYISKIASGHLPPASDRINKVLVKVLEHKSDLTYESLIIAKYKEIIPNDVLEILKKV